MLGSYDDRDGKIWLDGKLVEWRDANVHVLTHGLHYASSVFEGERCYNGKIFKGREHSERLRKSADYLDFEIPYTVDEIRPQNMKCCRPMAGQTPMSARLRGAVPGRTWAYRLHAIRYILRLQVGNGAITTAMPR